MRFRALTSIVLDADLGGGIDLLADADKLAVGEAGHVAIEGKRAVAVVDDDAGAKVAAAIGRAIGIVDLPGAGGVDR